MAETRPDPDQLLQRVQAEQAQARRGRLRIFFGAVAGVGKTYSMLEAARVARAQGQDVVVAYVEPHGRFETERLIEGLERIPTRAVAYRGVSRQELDVDAVLVRHPGIAIVDELAHSNPVGGEPPLRHPKRWQDVEELLDAGIHVWTTMNVQHLESLNDVVARITGVRQRETLPDRVFDEAHEIELIDLPPEDLLARLRAGKIYAAADASAATEHFFKPANLLALRELALRRMTARVGSASRASLGAERTAPAWQARDRLLVATGPDPQSEQTIRAGKRLADALDAAWTVVYVETPALLRLSTGERDRRVALLRLAESLGAETVTLDGPSAVDALLEYTRTRQITRVVVGAPKRRGWRVLLRRSTATELARRAQGFDVIVVAASDSLVDPADARRRADLTQHNATVAWPRYLAALAICLLCTAIAAPMYGRFELSNLVMIYLLGVVGTGLRFGRGPSVLAAVLNVAAFDFFFVPPRFTFAVSDVQYLVTFGVMLVVALVIATLMAHVRQQTRVAGARERRTASLYAMSRELAAARDPAAMARIAVRHVAEVFQGDNVVLLPDAAGRLRYPAAAAMPGSLHKADLAVAQWVHDHGRRAGLGSDTLPATPALYLPLGEVSRPLGVLAVQPRNARRVLLPEQLHLLETFASQIGVAIERGRLAAEAEAARVAAQGENLRNTLLASISHDLRTPLAVIAGAGSALAEQEGSLDAGTRVSLARSIETRAREMSELVSNVLDLTRFESGAPGIQPGWETLDEILHLALQRVGDRLNAHPVKVELADNLQPLNVDAGLAVQLFANLFDNLVRHTPPGTSARVTAVNEGRQVRVVVEDDGPGLPPGEPDRLFDKFQRGSDEGSVGGVGLGLAICRAITKAHGGEIRASRGEHGGARFEVSLPAAENQS
jgi:two-component system sensor histidine kinase KdpD